MSNSNSRKFIILAVLAMLSISTSASATPVDDHCRARETRCEMKCSTSHKVGSAEHLRCNDECRNDEQFCRREGFTPDRTWWR